MHSLKRKPDFVLCQIDYICFFTGISDSKFRRSNSIIHGNCWELLHSFSNIHRFTLWCSHFKVPNTTVINIPAFFSPFCNFTQCWHWPTSDQTDLCTRPSPRPGGERGSAWFTSTRERRCVMKLYLCMNTTGGQWLQSLMRVSSWPRLDYSKPRCPLVWPRHGQKLPTDGKMLF